MLGFILCKCREGSCVQSAACWGLLTAACMFVYTGKCVCNLDTHRDICVYTRINLPLCVCFCVSVYIYIYRERKKETEYI